MKPFFLTIILLVGFISGVTWTVGAIGAESSDRFWSEVPDLGSGSGGSATQGGDGSYGSVAEMCIDALTSGQELGVSSASVSLTGNSNTSLEGEGDTGLHQVEEGPSEDQDLDFNSGHYTDLDLTQSVGASGMTAETWYRISYLNHDLLEPGEEELELLREAQRVLTKSKGANPRALDRFVKSNQRLVFSIARQYAHSGNQLMDLVQEGNIGLLRAIEKFDEKKKLKDQLEAGYRAEASEQGEVDGVDIDTNTEARLEMEASIQAALDETIVDGAKVQSYMFITYARWWIRQGILNSIRFQHASVHVSRNAWDRGYKINSFVKHFMQQKNRSPVLSEIAEALNLTIKQVNETMSVISGVIPDFFVNSEGEEVSVVDLAAVDTHSDEPSEMAELQLMRDLFIKNLDILTETEVVTKKEREAIDLYLKGYAPTEIGYFMGYESNGEPSGVYPRKLLSRAIDKLRKHFEEGGHLRGKKEERVSQPPVVRKAREKTKTREEPQIQPPVVSPYADFSSFEREAFSQLSLFNQRLIQALEGGRGLAEVQRWWGHEVLTLDSVRFLFYRAIDKLAKKMEVLAPHDQFFEKRQERISALKQLFNNLK